MTASSYRTFAERYLCYWQSPGEELLKLAKQCVTTYDQRCDLLTKQSRFVRAGGGYLTIRRQTIDELYSLAVSLGFKDSERAWVQFCYEQRTEDRP